MIDEKKLISELEKWMNDTEYLKEKYSGSVQFKDGTGENIMYAHAEIAYDVISTVIDKINEQPKVLEWIPCSERLPKKQKKEGINGIYKLCLVTLDDETVCIGSYMHDEKGWLTRKFYGEKEFSTDNTVVSWMQMPEPYKEKKIMNKTNVIQCKSCTEPTKSIVFFDGKNCNGIRWMCENTDCPRNDTAEKQKSEKQKRKKTHEINRKNGVDIRKLVKLRIRAQLNLVEAAEIVGVRTAQYSAWEREIEPIPVDKFNVLIEKYNQEIQNHRCNNCFYYNGEPGDGEQFCDSKEIYVPENNYCTGWMRKAYE